MISPAVQKLEPQNLAQPKQASHFLSNAEKSKVHTQEINWNSVDWSLFLRNSSFNAYYIDEPGKSFLIRPFPNTLKGYYIHLKMPQGLSFN